MADEPETQFCTQCQQDKPADQFYKVRKPGYKVTFCNECVKKNIEKWRKET
jgi:hypothetical protein